LTPLDPTKFATAKLNLVLDVSLDAGLPKLSLRIVGLFVGRYMRAEYGGAAFPRIKIICEELGVSSERAVRAALYRLINHGYLAAERTVGRATHYHIAERYFSGSAQRLVGTETQAHHEPGSFATQAHHEPGTQAHHEPGTQAHHEPPYNRIINPDIEYRKKPSQPSHQSGAERNWLSGKPQASSPGETPDAFGLFKASWQWRQGESLRAARAAFHRLSESDRESAIQGAPNFQSAMAGRQHPPHASTYLDERMWTCQARNAAAASQKTRPNGTFKNGVGVLLAESCFGGGAEPKFDAANVIDLEAVRLDHAEGPTTPAVPTHERDLRVVLHPRSQQLEAWHAYERRVHGRAKPGLSRPTEWPPEPSAPPEVGVEVAERQP